MALVLSDRIKETTVTTGTGTYDLAGALTGYEAFSVVGDGNTTFYSCTDGTNWEVGVGTYTASGTLLARTTVLNSSNSDNLVDWGAGTKTVFCTYPAKRAPSASMTATTYVTTHSSTLSDTQTIDSGVLAGPVTITGTQTVTGTLVVI